MEYKEKRELHLHLLDSLTDCIKRMCMFNKFFQRKIRTSTETQLHQYITSALSLLKELNLLPNARNCRHITGWLHVEYFGGQSHVVRGQLLLLLKCVLNAC